MAVGEDAKDVVMIGEEIVRIDDLKPWSTYRIQVVAYNLLNGRKLKSKEARTTITTLGQS